MDLAAFTLVSLLFVLIAWLGALTYLGHVERSELRREIDILSLKLAAAHVEQSATRVSSRPPPPEVAAREAVRPPPPVYGEPTLPKRSPVLVFPPSHPVVPLVSRLDDEHETETRRYSRHAA